MLQTGNGVNEFPGPKNKKKAAEREPSGSIFQSMRLRRGSNEEPFDDPVVGLLSAWPAHQLSSDRYVRAAEPKPWRHSSSGPDHRFHYQLPLPRTSTPGVCSSNGRLKRTPPL
jgi:hypothetical protein